MCGEHVVFSRKLKLSLAAIFLISALFFFWGLYVGIYKAPPFQQIRYLRSVLLSNDAITVNRNVDVSARVAVPCPSGALTLVIVGQSNSANSLPSFGEKRSGIPAFNFFDGRCYEIDDPVLGASGQRGSLWVDFSHQLSATLHGRPIILITGAVGGRTVGAWSDNKEQISSYVVSQIEYATRRSITPDAFIWLQGEADAANYTSTEHYVASLSKVISRFRSASGSQQTPWLMFETSRCSMTATSGSSEIRWAQRHVARSISYVKIVMNTDNLGDRYRYDGCHFNDNGKRAIIEKLVPAVVSVAQAQNK